MRETLLEVVGIVVALAGLTLLAWPLGLVGLGIVVAYAGYVRGE